MWSHRLTSGNPDHPTVKDVLSSLLNRLMKKKQTSSWLHVEVDSKHGWFGNLLIGEQPWLEVGYGEDFLELNCGIPKSQSASIPSLPEKWQEKRKMWLVPHQDVEELIDWMDKCLSQINPGAALKVSGWIEG